MTEQRERDPYRAAQALMDEKRFLEAYRIYLDLANKGNSWAQVRVGWMHHEGVGVPHDSAQARKWFQQAASLGSASGAFYCGRAAAARKEWDEAVKWFTQAAQKEYGPALLWLGLVFLRGYGVPVNLQKAVAYLERGACAGNYYARRELGILMFRGKLGLARIPFGLLLLLKAAAVAVVQFLSGKHDDKLMG